MQLPQRQPDLAGPIRVIVDGIPTPQQMVRVESGIPYLVPDGKLFVLTGLGAAESSINHVRLIVNGVVEVGRDQMLNASLDGSWDTTSIAPAPPGFTAAPGDILEVTVEGVEAGRAWGYLVDA
jgi:hypothetical protein